MKQGKSNGDETVVSVEADGHSSIKFRLSNGATLVAIGAGGESFTANARNRDALVAALQRTLERESISVPDAE